MSFIYPLPVARHNMYACPHCESTKMFIAYKEGMLIRVLEDHEDVEGLEDVGELLCADCNRWFPNPTLGAGAHERVLTGELVTITGLRGTGTIKVVATGVTMPFHYDTYEEEAVETLRRQDEKFLRNLHEFSDFHDHQIALRVKEEGNPNTWVYRLNARRLWRGLK